MGAPRAAAWFSLDDDQRIDAVKVADLEAMADVAAGRLDFASAAANMAEADGLRAKWSQPRVRFASLEAMFDELEALAALSAELSDDGTDGTAAGRYDIRALRELGERASTVGVALETLADDIEADLEVEG